MGVGIVSVAFVTHLAWTVQFPSSVSSCSCHLLAKTFKLLLSCIWIINIIFRLSFAEYYFYSVV